jgi:predicted DNA-binding protein (UPF0251 family)
LATIGSVKRDTNKSNVKHDVLYPYTEAGVHRLLRDVYRLVAEAEDYGDINAVCLRVDLERALQSQALTPRQRVAIGLYYFAQLTERECARLLNVRRQPFERRLRKAIKNIALYIQGDDIKTSQEIIEYKLPEGNIFRSWVIDMLDNRRNWWVIDDTVIKCINELLGFSSQDISHCFDTDNKQYVLLTRDKLRRIWENEVLCPNVHPRLDDAGYLIGKSGSKIRLPNRALYI